MANRKRGREAEQERDITVRDRLIDATEAYRMAATTVRDKVHLRWEF